MKKTRTEDLDFLRWVELVSRSESDCAKIRSVPWDDILQVLFQIFKILQSLGCFSAAMVTRKVKRIMADGLVGTLPKLSRLRDEIVAKHANKGVKL